ncbi:type IX secretion system protein PorG [Algibacter pacificus]|uniref:type IX secretion system protein PorG n=1 Tax=Algibacter pacificus TaxID=2599389 RepID=UPI0011CBAA1B|nr:DUF6089 family protein [Algibacter pacificus]
MRYLIILILSLLCSQINNAQINEIGVFAGGSNLIGDVGATTYIAPNSLTLGLLYKYNRSARHSYRLSVIHANLRAQDSDSSDPRRLERGYSVDTKILEFAAGIEFTFVDFNLHEGRTIGTPYIYSGITATRHSNNYYLNNTQMSEGAKGWAAGIPMTLGYKTNILGKFILGFEIGARYTFTDNLDGNFPENESNQLYRFGNINNNDWYTFTGITLTYTFGIKPCYCND